MGKLDSSFALGWSQSRLGSLRRRGRRRRRPLVSATKSEAFSVAPSPKSELGDWGFRVLLSEGCFQGSPKEFYEGLGFNRVQDLGVQGLRFKAQGLG